MSAADLVRVCLLDDVDLTDTMGCYVFVMDGGRYVERGSSAYHRLCVSCNTKRGGNGFSVAEYDAAVAAFDARRVST